MKRKRIPLILALALFTAGSCHNGEITDSPSSNSLRARHPNILIILTDDQRFSAIGAWGMEPVLTPHMDELAREGISFKQAHIMGGLQPAVCCPSRAMLMTGISLFHQHRDGLYIPDADTTMPEYFRNQGYETFGAGKWHNGEASYHRSFEKGGNIFFSNRDDPNPGGNSHLRPYLFDFDSTGKFPRGFRGDHFSSIYFADATISFLKDRKDRQRPFFIYTAFFAPHDPRVPPAEFRNLYDSSKIKLPPNWKPDHPFDNGELNIRDEELLPHPRTPEAVRGQIASYYGMISEVDHEIGRILDALKASGEYENTIIVFAGDNGLAVGQHGLLGKQNMYDHSIRVPLIIAGPGIPKNRQSEAYCYLLDIFPTLCATAGYGVPREVEGVSLESAFKDPVAFRGRDHLFFAYSNQQRAVKKDGYKLIRYEVKGVSRVQFFDLNKDPYETKDLSADTTWHKRREELEALLAADMKHYGDFCEPDRLNWGQQHKLTDQERNVLNP